jgi:hypothetical protein
MIKVYISGKVSGLDHDTAFKSFEDAEKWIVSFGKIPINPMKFCPSEPNFDPSWTWEQYMDVCCRELLRCEEIFMLKDWGHSRGARVEHAMAKELGLSIYFQN